MVGPVVFELLEVDALHQLLLVEEMLRRGRVQLPEDAQDGVVVPFALHLLIALIDQANQFVVLVFHCGHGQVANEQSALIERQHLFPNETAGETPQGDEAVSFQEATRRFQAQLLRSTLDQTGWNVSEAARKLDVARSYVYKPISALGLERSTS